MRSGYDPSLYPAFTCGSAGQMWYGQCRPALLASITLLILDSNIIVVGWVISLSSICADTAKGRRYSCVALDCHLDPKEPFIDWAIGRKCRHHAMVFANINLYLRRACSPHQAGLISSSGCLAYLILLLITPFLFAHLRNGSYDRPHREG